MRLRVQIFKCFMLLFVLTFYTLLGYCDKVKLSTLEVKQPLAQLVELKGEGLLMRGEAPSIVNYNINTPGIGFKKGDSFTVSANSSSDYALITLTKDGISTVRLGPGAIITFLDDDGNYAITGVFVQSSTPGTYAQVLFNINHASPTNQFLVFTPDVVVGVRGTAFEINVGYQQGGTQIIGLKKSTSTGLVWTPNDIWVAIIDQSKVPIPQYTYVKKYVYDVYKSSLSSILKPVPSPASLPSSLISPSGPSAILKKIYIQSPYYKVKLTKSVCSPTCSIVTSISATPASSSYYVQLQALISSMLSAAQAIISNIKTKIKAGMSKMGKWWH